VNILVAIANYGFKNLEFLKTVIKEYQSMPYHVDIVVLSNVPKELGPGIQVKIGLPSKDPWSLPFGHKKIFVERLEEYDLFIYTEDDILITSTNIDSFLQLTEMLPKGEISGFLRYELDSTGRKWFPDFCGPYHWFPKSVDKRDQYTVAEFSNAHSACYILTRDQLRAAISSGGYLVDPHQGRYDLLCTAATDPYTQCKLKKVICISQISDSLVHHLSNRYVRGFGIDQSDFERQIAFMLSDEYSAQAQQELFVTNKNIDSFGWDKVYFDNADHNLLSMVSKKRKNILSVGCGYPSTEEVLIRNGHAVTAIPLDPIIGVLSASRGIKTVESNFEKAFQSLKGNMFECIIVSNVLQHLKDPLDLLSRAAELLIPNGEFIISVPNFWYLNYLREYFPYPIFKKWTYSKSYLTMIDKHHIGNWLRAVGVNGTDYQYIVRSPFLKKISPSFGVFNFLLADRLFVRGRKQGVSANKAVDRRI